MNDPKQIYKEKIKEFFQDGFGGLVFLWQKIQRNFCTFTQTKFMAGMNAFLCPDENIGRVREVCKSGNYHTSDQRQTLK